MSGWIILFGLAVAVPVALRLMMVAADLEELRDERRFYKD